MLLREAGAEACLRRFLVALNAVVQGARDDTWVGALRIPDLASFVNLFRGQADVGRARNSSVREELGVLPRARGAADRKVSETRRLSGSPTRAGSDTYFSSATASSRRTASGLDG
jgi:hypothetical protein